MSFVEEPVDETPHETLTARIADLVGDARASGSTWADVERALHAAADDARRRAQEEAVAAGAPGEGDGGVAGGGAGEGAGAGAGAGAGEVRTPEHTAKVGPVTLFNEMEALARAGRRGWRVVGSGSSVHLVVRTDEQWEFRRVLASRRTGQALEAEGWQRFSPGWFPWGYYQRPTGRAPEPEDVVGGFVVNP